MDLKRIQSLINWKSGSKKSLVSILLFGLILFALLFFLVIWVTLSQETMSDSPVYSLWRLSFLIFIFVQILINIVLIAYMLTQLHRASGAFPRLEAQLDKILAGDFKARLGVREKDDAQLAIFVKKLNLLLDILEKKNT